MSKELQNKILFQQIAELLQNARQQVLRKVNTTMVCTYFEIGRVIVEEEQNGKDRAEYGKQILKGLSEQLTKEFGKGFSVVNLENMRKFYQTYSISSTLSTILEITNSSTLMTNSEIVNLEEIYSAKTKSLTSFFKLTWSHYVFLMRIDDEKERRFTK